jgi:hypothetical protein
MDVLNRYLELVIACTLALFISASSEPAMAQAKGSQEDSSWGPENWALEYQDDEDVDKGDVPKEGVYQDIEDNCGLCYKVAGQYLVALFNIDMDQGQSYGGSIFEFRRQATQVSNNSPGNNFISSVDSFDNLSARRQVGDINIATLGQFGP